MPSTKKTRIKKRQLHAPGDIVFAKLRGYPWWPAKIQDETKVPKHVVETKKKKKVSSDSSTVFFFGSLDYAFISEKLIRPFDPEAVRKGISDDKFRNKDLLLALEQALDPCGLDFLFKTQKQQNIKRKKKQPSHTASNTSPIATESTTTAATTTTTTATTTDNGVATSSNYKEQPSSSRKGTLKRALDVDLGDDTDKKKCSIPVKTTKTRPMVSSDGKSRPLLYTSKSLEAAGQKSPNYERHFKRIYVMRHKLQKLIYGKKPGEIPLKDYQKIAVILTDIEKCDMTKELLKETQIGKIIRFGCDYQFDTNNGYRLQEQCLGILKTWSTTFLDLTEHRQPETCNKTPPPAAKVVTFASSSSTPNSNDSNSADEVSLSLDNHNEDNAVLVEKEEHDVDIETRSLTVSPVLDAQQINDKDKNKAISAPISDRSKAIMTSTMAEQANDLINDNFISPTTIQPINNTHNDETAHTPIPAAPPIDSRIENVKENEPPPSTTTSTRPIDNAKVDGENKHQISNTVNEQETPSPSTSTVSISDNIDIDGESDASTTITQAHLPGNPIVETHQNNIHGTIGDDKCTTTQPCYGINLAGNMTDNDNDNVAQKTISSGDEIKSQKKPFYGMDSSTPTTTDNPILLPKLLEKDDNDEWRYQQQQQLQQQQGPDN